MGNVFGSVSSSAGQMVPGGLFARLPAALVLVLSILFQPAIAVEGPVSEARALLERGEADEAYRLLAALEPEHAGNPEFDYWLGLAAVRAGEPSQALFPLERVLAREPLNAGARLELVGAYIQLGQRDNAVTELERLEQLDPPPRARRAMDEARRQLGVEPPERQQRATGLSGYLGLELGHDSNPGSWPETELELLPGITGEISPDETLFAGLQGGVRHRIHAGERQNFSISANGMVRRNDEEAAEQFDLDFLQLEGQWGYRLNGHQEIGAGVEGGELRLDGDHYRQMLGLWGEWRNQLREDLQYRVRLGWRDMDFEADRFDHDEFRAVLAMQYQHTERWRTDLDLDLRYEDAVSERPGENAFRQRIRGRTFYMLNPRHRLGADLALRWTQYSEDYTPVEALDFDNGDQSRRDRSLVLGAQWEYFPAEGWLVRARAQHRDQSSSLDLFEYDQTLVNLGVTRFF